MTPLVGASLQLHPVTCKILLENGKVKHLNIFSELIFTPNLREQRERFEKSKFNLILKSNVECDQTDSGLSFIFSWKKRQGSMSHED